MKAATRKLRDRCRAGRISIHAAREGGDAVDADGKPTAWISIHAAREGGDGFGSCPCRRAERFQSTPPVKAATKLFCNAVAGSLISIHAAREGGDLESRPSFRFSGISIHAAREGGDTNPCKVGRIADNFNPRRP